MPAPSPRLRARLEDAFGAWARLLARIAPLVVLAMLGLAAYLTTRIPEIQVKTATEDFLFENDPIRATYDAFKYEFGQDQIALVTIEPPEVFDREFLERLVAFHRDLEDELPYLEDITSLWNVRSVRGRGDELVVEDLLEEMPESDADLAALRERVLSTPSYRTRGLIAEDGGATSVLLEVATYSSTSPEDGDDLLGGFEESDSTSTKRPFLTGPENDAFIRALKDVIARYDAPDFRIRPSGGTLFTHELTMTMAEDVPRFFGGGLLAIVVLLGLLFRRFSPVLLCILVVVPGVASTFGLAAVLGIPFSVTSQLIPSFLLAVGVGYTVHLVTIFLRELGHGVTRAAALEAALRHSGLPIAMTAVTTITGMLSFLAAQMKPILEMGLLAALGAAVSVVFALTLLPALLVLLPIAPKADRESPFVQGLLGRLAGFSARHAWPIVGATAALTLCAFGLMSLLRVSSNPTSWLPADHPYRVASDFAEARFGGGQSYELLIETGREGGVKEPAVLSAIESLDEVVADHRARGARLTHTSSIVEIVKESHQALHGDDPAYYVIPQDEALVAQELLLFENGGADDLEKVVDPAFTRTHVTLKTTWRDGVHLARFIRESQADFQAKVAGLASLEITGLSAVVSRTVDATTESMLRSYALALALITPLMMLLIGSLRAGLVSMVPNLVPIAMTLGLMGLLDIPIDMFTLLAGCIAIGLAVDDTIHFIAGFRRYLAQGHDAVRAVDLTMQSTGRALLFTSVVLTSGFLVLTLSSLLNLQQVGILTSFAIASAFLLDVTVTPALLVLTHRRPS
ncbi:MAG: MMPL family transporter [Myxococcales bacterium]|nr:MMPL family transporter [Myxococcales bacterium]